MWIRLPRSSTERWSTRFASAALPAAPAADEIRQRARSVLEKDYQAELPEGPRLPDVDLPDLGLLADVALVILVALGVAALILAVLWLAQSLSSKRERSPASPGQPGSLVEAPANETGPSLAEAERLAAEGRWSEAVHALLLIAVRRLCARFSVPQASSRTSRELVRALPLQGESREAFTSLVRTVEISLFGGTPLGPDDWQSSLDRFRRIEGRG
jgi:hypothetical protein